MKQLLLVLGICITTPSCYGQAGKQVKQPAANGFALVELFTSEGCSSCPPAEALMPELKRMYGNKLHVLAFHVDYWNRLGWKDPFSSSQYTERQQQYAAIFPGGSVYTPQAIINGTEQRVGSGKAALQSVIDAALQRAPEINISLTAKKNTAGGIVVSYDTKLEKNEVLHIALVQRKAVVPVKRGENEGRELTHEDMVRVFETTGKSSGQADIALPPGLSFNDVYILAFVQHTGNMRITGISETAVAP